MKILKHARKKIQKHVKSNPGGTLFLLFMFPGFRRLISLQPVVLSVCLWFLQLMYKQNRQDASSLYHLMPETIDTQFAREQSEMLSEVRLSDAPP